MFGASMKRKSAMGEGNENSIPQDMTNKRPKIPTRVRSGVPKALEKCDIDHSKNIKPDVNPTPLKQFNVRDIKNINRTPSTGNKFRANNSFDVQVIEKVKDYFDSGITVSVDKVNSILMPLKKLSKMDNREKSKRTEAFIKEASSALNQVVIDIQGVRSQCINHESTINNQLRHAQSQFLEQGKIISSLSESDVRIKSDNVKLKTELESTKNKYSDSVNEKNRLQEQVHRLEEKISDIESRKSREETMRSESQNAMLQLQRELMEAQMKSAKCVNETKQECEQKYELKVQQYINEIESLRREIDRKQNDAEKTIGERAEQDRKNVELREELLRQQSNFREAENTIIRLERDIERLSADLAMTRTQLAQKDADLRNTLNSLSDLQRQYAEEKGALRAELGMVTTRLNALEEERLTTTAELVSKREESSAANRELHQLRETVRSLEEKLASKEEELLMINELKLQVMHEKEMRSISEIREDSERRERIAASAQLMAIQTESALRIRDVEEKMTHQVGDLKKEIQLSQDEKMRLEKESHAQTELIVGLRSEIQQLRQALDNASTNNESVEELGKVSAELEIFKIRMKELSESKENEKYFSASKIKELEEQVRQGEIQRRKLHNVIQELRGNVRVFARIRPFLPNDGVDMSNQESAIIARTDGTSLKIAKKTQEDKVLDENSFSYDRVFGPTVSQEHIFLEVSEFVQSALDGYNVCLFSYGQTGSGKTHTMQGSGNGNMRGIIPRAMEQVGKYKTELETMGWKYSMEVSFVEIYNETIRDLLRTSSNDDLKHEIKKDINGNTTITDVQMMKVDPNNSEQIERIMELAARHRSVGQTAMNERSSRSHSIFTLHLSASNEQQGVTLKGTLSLVDLAGSERLDRSGVTGDRMKEAIAINKSLSSLTDVFVALGNKQAHIPYRNSKLTTLLQPALSGEGKTLMLVNLSPTDDSYHESLCSLRFASQVNQCELGKPRRQVKDCTTTTASSFSNPTCSSSASTSHGSSTSLTPRKRPAPTPMKKK